VNVNRIFSVLKYLCKSRKGYDVGKKERPPFLPAPAPTQDDDEEEPIPDELICLLCKDLLVDAVVIPCCGNSYCDDCKSYQFTMIVTLNLLYLNH